MVDHGMLETRPGCGWHDNDNGVKALTVLAFNQGRNQAALSAVRSTAYDGCKTLVWQWGLYFVAYDLISVGLAYQNAVVVLHFSDLHGQNPCVYGAVRYLCEMNTRISTDRRVLVDVLRFIIARIGCALQRGLSDNNLLFFLFLFF